MLQIPLEIRKQFRAFLKEFPNSGDDCSAPTSPNADVRGSSFQKSMPGDLAVPLRGAAVRLVFVDDQPAIGSKVEKIGD